MDPLEAGRRRYAWFHYVAVTGIQKENGIFRKFSLILETLKKKKSGKTPKEIFPVFIYEFDLKSI